MKPTPPLLSASNFPDPPFLAQSPITMPTNRIHSRQNPNPLLPPSPHRRRHPAGGLLSRCASDPVLPLPPPSSAVLFRRQTCFDVFASPILSAPPSPLKHKKYGEESKVVVSVTVEGSPGPVRVMVRLGASVEETIKIVVERYSAEGRSPCLSRDGPGAFELHSSYFSLESLKRTDKIGCVGSRSFYLRKTRSENKEEETSAIFPSPRDDQELTSSSS